MIHKIVKAILYVCVCVWMSVALYAQQVDEGVLRFSVRASSETERVTTFVDSIRVAFYNSNDVSVYEQLFQNVTFRDGVGIVDVLVTTANSEFIEIAVYAEIEVSFEGETDSSVVLFDYVTHAIVSDVASMGGSVLWDHVLNQPLLSDVDGRISIDQIADRSILDSKISEVNAASITGRISHQLIPTANESLAGKIRVGDNLSISEEGTLSLDISMDSLLVFNLVTQDRVLSESEVLLILSNYFVNENNVSITGGGMQGIVESIGVFSISETGILQLDDAEIQGIRNENIAENTAIAFSKLNITKADLLSLGIPSVDTKLSLSALDTALLEEGFFKASNIPILSDAQDGFITLGNYVEMGFLGNLQQRTFPLQGIRNEDILEDAAISFSKLMITSENIIALGIPSEDRVLLPADVVQYARGVGLASIADVPTASVGRAGVFKVGNGLIISPEGVLSAVLSNIEGLTAENYVGIDRIQFSKLRIDRGDILSLGIPVEDTTLQAEDIDAILEDEYIRYDSIGFATQTERGIAILGETLTAEAGAVRVNRANILLQDRHISAAANIDADRLELTSFLLRAIGVVVDDTVVSTSDIENTATMVGYRSDQFATKSRFGVIEATVTAHINIQDSVLDIDPLGMLVATGDVSDSVAAWRDNQTLVTEYLKFFNTVNVASQYEGSPNFVFYIEEDDFNYRDGMLHLKFLDDILLNLNRWGVLEQYIAQLDTPLQDRVRSLYTSVRGTASQSSLDNTQYRQLSSQLQVRLEQQGLLYAKVGSMFSLEEDGLNIASDIVSFYLDEALLKGSGLPLTYFDFATVPLNTLNNINAEDILDALALSTINIEIVLQEYFNTFFQNAYYMTNDVYASVIDAIQEVAWDVLVQRATSKNVGSIYDYDPQYPLIFQASPSSQNAYTVTLALANQYIPYDAFPSRDNFFDKYVVYDLYENNSSKSHVYPTDLDMSTIHGYVLDASKTLRYAVPNQLYHSYIALKPTNEMQENIAGSIGVLADKQDGTGSPSFETAFLDNPSGKLYFYGIQDKQKGTSNLRKKVGQYVLSNVYEGWELDRQISLYIDGEKDEEKLFIGDNSIMYLKGEILIQAGEGEYSAGETVEISGNVIYKNGKFESMLSIDNQYSFTIDNTPIIREFICESERVHGGCYVIPKVSVQFGEENIRKKIDVGMHITTIELIAL